ncbi:MAG: CidA/LrgA family protein [Bacteroidia bacterium]|nr:CidA/LrgA family protein [Bacteroidia bacterium]
MKYLLQGFIILACLGFGELLIFLTDWPIPSAVIGMLFLTFLLQAGWVKPTWVQDVSAWLLKSLSFFFVPAGVGIMLYFDLISNSYPALITASLLSFLLALFSTGFTHQWLLKLTKKQRKNAHLD